MADIDEHQHDEPTTTDTDAQPPPPPKKKGADKERLRPIVRELLEELLGDDDDQPDDKGDEPKGPQTPASVEHRTEHNVASEVERVLADRDHKAEHDKLRNPPAEAPPRRERKLTKLLWGGD